jgi:hypothetical protein
MLPEAAAVIAGNRALLLQPTPHNNCHALLCAAVNDKAMR